MAERIVGGVTSVRVGRSNLAEVAGETTGIVAVLAQPSVAQVAEEVVAALSASGAEMVAVRLLPDGEGAKTLATVEETIRWMSDAGMRRDSTVIGIGGGALTDATGFIASIYMRGVRVRYVPTTLLGAVDAAIGGKTAVNVSGKNLAGTFRHPERVVIDISILEHLDDASLRQGLAEVVKAGAIGDSDLFALVETGRWRADLEEAVWRAIAVKADIVEADFRESGHRMHLNFGHTVGHAIESTVGWSHGHAVAAGMVAAAAISRQVVGFVEFDRLVDTLQQLGLPVTCPGADALEVIAAAGRDKKMDAAGLRMVLLEAIGRPTVSHIDTATLRSGLEAIGIT